MAREEPLKLGVKTIGFFRVLHYEIEKYTD